MHVLSKTLLTRGNNEIGPSPDGLCALFDLGIWTTLAVFKTVACPKKLRD